MSLQADLKAAELAKRGLEAERKELAQLRDALRQQQAQAATEAARLADLHKVGGSYQLAGWAVDASSGSGCCRWASQRFGLFVGSVLGWYADELQSFGVRNRGWKMTVLTGRVCRC